MKYIFHLLIFLSFSVPFYAQSWDLQLDLNEPDFPSVDITLVDAVNPVFTMDYDVLAKGNLICSGLPNTYVYSKGNDNIDDIRVTMTRITNVNNPWTQIEGEWDDTSVGSFRSDYNISNGQSRSNDWAYIKVEFEFLDDLPSSICPSYFATRHTSTNGSTEAYEWTIVSINDELTSAEEAMISNYTHLNYNDLSLSPYFLPDGTVDPMGAATNISIPNGQSMSEFITGSTDPDAQGGIVRSALWAIDDFNTTILDGPEAALTNPAAGNGSTNDNQIISATPVYNAGATNGNFGMNLSDQITKITYYFGLADVAFDTDGDGITRTNTLPAAGVTWFNLGFPDPPTVASTNGTCNDMSGTAIVNINNGTPNFVVSGDLSATSSSSSIMFTQLMAGTYNFMVTDARGCETTGSLIVSNDCGVLPVELVYFDAVAEEESVHLLWETASENNNSHFDVQRSNDGSSFETIGTILGNGTSTQTSNYKFKDLSPNAGLNYYSIKQVDFDGAFEFSEIVVVSMVSDLALSILELGGNNVIEILSPKLQFAAWQLFGLSGQLVADGYIQINNGKTTLALPNGLSKGVYVFRLSPEQSHSLAIKFFAK